jgi:hypothetical protein
MILTVSATITQPATLLEHALAYAGRRWSIIPVVVQGKPAGSWKPFQACPADETSLRQHFAEEGVTGLAVVLGQESGGLAVRDFDEAVAYRAWAADHPDDAARLPTVRTACGFQVYGRLAEEAFADLGDGELWADSGRHVLLPPSLHPVGHVYAWLIPLPEPSAALPFLPPSLTAPRGERTRQTQQPIACVPPAAIEAIEATLPHGPGQRNRRVFDLVRRLRRLAGLDTSPATLQAIVAEWHCRALAVIRTKELAETWTDFQSAWQQPVKPCGATLRATCNAARRVPQGCIDGREELGVLAASCRNLGTGGRPFILSCRTVARHFGVPLFTAWRWLQALHFHGIIQPAEKERARNRRATTWRYTGPQAQPDGAAEPLAVVEVGVQRESAAIRSRSGNSEIKLLGRQ